MKPEEAIKILEKKKEYSERITDNFLSHSRGEIKDANETIEMCDMAISALKEIQQYREIGTVKECREAVEKQRPKKIIIESYCPTECPTCGHELSKSLGDGYYKYPIFLERCPNCGQEICWEESEEKQWTR